MNEEEEIKLTARELAIAEKAANLAVDRVLTKFYAGVGKSVVNRLLILIGAAVVAFVVGKGWLTIGDLQP